MWLDLCEPPLAMSWAYTGSQGLPLPSLALGRHRLGVLRQEQQASVTLSLFHPVNGLRLKLEEKGEVICEPLTHMNSSSRGISAGFDLTFLQGPERKSISPVSFSFGRLDDEL